MRITDREVLDKLVARFASSTGELKDARVAAAEALGLGAYPQFHNNWRTRGVPRGWRYVVWVACRNRGIEIDKDWCRASKTRAERTSLAKSLRWVEPIANEGAPNGKTTGKRERPTQRRTAAGRSVPAMAR